MVLLHACCVAVRMCGFIYGGILIRIIILIINDACMYNHTNSAHMGFSDLSDEFTASILVMRHEDDVIQEALCRWRRPGYFTRSWSVLRKVRYTMLWEPHSRISRALYDATGNRLIRWAGTVMSGRKRAALSVMDRATWVRAYAFSSLLRGSSKYMEAEGLALVSEVRVCVFCFACIKSSSVE